MKKTKTFEQYLKEADNRLSPLEDEDENPLDGVGSAVDNLANIMDKIPSEDEPTETELPEEEAVDDVSDELEDDTSDELPEDEFELDTVPSEETVLEPEEQPVDEPVEVASEMPMETELLSEPKKTVYLYAGVNNINQEDTAFNAVEQAKNSMQGCDCEVIRLFQLNIQPVATEEPEDGMQIIYDQIADADVIILASPISGGAVSSLATNAIDRISNHYGPNGLKNKIFGSILVGADDSYSGIKANLASKAINLGMIVAPEGNIHVGGMEETDFSTFATSIASLRDATDSIRTDTIEPGIEDGGSDVMSFGEFSNTADDVATELAPEVEPTTMDETPADEMPMDEMPMDEMPADDESADELTEEPDDETEEIPAEDMLDDESADELTEEPDDELTEEPDEEEEIEIMGENKDWHFPTPPSVHKKLNKIQSFSEVTTKKGSADEFKNASGTSQMPKTKVDTKKGASKETTIKNKKSPNFADTSLKNGKGTSKLPKSKKVSKKGSHVDSGARVDVRYFKGLKSTSKTGAKKGGDGVENFADFTKRI